MGAFGLIRKAWAVVKSDHARSCRVPAINYAIVASVCPIFHRRDRIHFLTIAAEGRYTQRASHAPPLHRQSQTDPRERPLDERPCCDLGSGPARWREAVLISQIDFLQNPPPANGGGLFVPVIGSRLPTPSHMKTTPAAHRAAPARPPGSFDFVEDSVFLLGLLYLELGLPPEFAFRAALADYDCALERSEPCPR
jgi:hypothetical protein